MHLQKVRSSITGYWLHEALHRIRNTRKSPEAQSSSRSGLSWEEEAEFRPLQREDAKSGSRPNFLGRSGIAVYSMKETRVR